MNEPGFLLAVLDRIDEGILLFDQQGMVFAINRKAAALLGCQPTAWVGRGAAETVGTAELMEQLRQTLDAGLLLQESGGRLRSGNGDELAFAYALAPLQVDGIAQGAMLRFSEPLPLPVCDVALRDSEVKLQTVLDTIADGVIAIAENGGIRLFNPAAERLFGYSGDELMGKNVNLLMPEPDRMAHDGYIDHYLRTGQRKIIGIGREVMGLRKDGKVFPLYLSIGEARLGQERLFVAVLRDLTARKQAEEQLLTLSRAVEQSPNAIMITDLNGRVEYVNPSFTLLTGYTQAEVEGKNPSFLRSAQTTSKQYQRLWQTLREAGEWREEIQDCKKNGELYWALETISPVRNSAGKVTHFLSIQQDISEQKHDKEALEASEERFREVADMTGEWLWEQDPQGRYLYSSNAVAQILGYQPADIIGKSYLSLLTAEDRQRWADCLPEGNQAAESFRRLINRYQHRDRHEVFTESSGKPLFDDNGVLVKWLGVDHDITERKASEDALRLRERAIEAASVGINITDARDPRNPIIYLNPALSKMTGYSYEELLGHSMAMLQGKETDPDTVCDISKAIREGRGCEAVVKNYRKDGSTFWNELLISPVFNDDGKLTHFIGIQSDVTERRRAEEERHELEIAKQIQTSLLPKQPLQTGGLQIAGVCLPATHVGGDYFDYFCAQDGMHIVIADVSGHSVGAALMMAGVRNTLKAESRKANQARNQATAAEILLALNELLHEDLNGPDLFISMFYMRYDPQEKRLCFSNAGHNCPLWLPVNDDRCWELDAEGMVIGVRKQVAFEDKCVSLQAGDKIILYTDGITESEDKNGEFFGVERLSELLIANRHESPESTINQILASLRQFCGSNTFNDDVSMVVINIE